MKTCDAYKETKIFEYPNAIVRVHIPDISQEERERRMKSVCEAAAELLKNVKHGN